MILKTVLALVAGCFVGLLADSPIIEILVEHKAVALYMLMFFVGISIGLHKGIVKEIREYHFKIFLIPFGIILGSLVGGGVCSVIFGHSLADGLAIAGGLGWYSLAGVTITNLASPEIGSIAFISNLMREIMAIALIPVIAKHLNYYTCLAPAGATSEDTSLPMLVKYTNTTVVVLAIFNGVICSVAAPIIISICYLL